MESRDAALIGTSVALQRVREDVACCARAEAKVLITGERGLGKETLCRHIHTRSRRAGGPLVTFNCRAVPEPRLLSELAGKFALAREGTLFLDNVDALGASVQTELLRSFENGVFAPDTAGPPSQPLNVRVISASNRNLYALVTRREFRDDLYYRLNVLHITVPPLRERREDVRELVRHFLDVFSRHNATPTPELSDKILGALESYDWPGNIRELREQLERMALKGTASGADPLDWITSPSRRMRATP